MSDTVTDLKLPLLDLRKFDGSPADRAGFLASLKVAARDVGFFFLTGHGISDALTSDVLALSRRFFALPDAEKLKVEMVNSPHFRG